MKTTLLENLPLRDHGEWKIQTEKKPDDQVLVVITVWKKEKQLLKQLKQTNAQREYHFKLLFHFGVEYEVWLEKILVQNGVCSKNGEGLEML